MRLPIFATCALACSLGSLTAQNAIVMTGRFFADSLDGAVDSTTGQNLTRLDDNSMWLVTPSSSGAAALDVFSQASFNTYWGDAYADNNFSRWDGFTTTFERFDIAGLFVPFASKANAAFQPLDVYWTVRDDSVNKNMQVLDVGGTSTVIVRPGDWLRLRPNGFLEYFITLDQFDTACNSISTTPSFGATAMCQDSAGNLYFSPAEQGGVVVNGNSNPVTAGRDSIIRIDAADITYAPNGTVASVTPDSAYVIFDGVTTQGWLANAGLQDNGRSGTVMQMTSYYNLVGLDLDPNGGMIPATVPIDDPANPGTDLFPMMPNFVMTADNGFIGGTIWSSAGGGSVAVINGVSCGSTLAGVPATGAWLGTATDGDLLPTLMGFQIVGAPTERPCVIDTSRSGSIDPLADSIEIDVKGEPGEATTLLLSLTPPLTNFLFPLDISPLGTLFAPGSWPDFFPISPAPIDIPLGVTDPNGYTEFLVANPTFGDPVNEVMFRDLILVCQVVQLRSTAFDVLLSNPVILQFK